MKVKTKSNGSVKKNETAKTAEEKRLESIAAKKKQYKICQNAIKSALANVDTTRNKKLIFNDEESNLDQSIQITSIRNGNTLGKQGLFDGSDNDESEVEYNFEVKEQFQGKKGKKLMELQSKFKNDKRFMLDERFLEEDNDNESEPKPVVRENGVVENELVEEKQAELAILEEVLGGKIRKKSTEAKKTSSKSMLRYDPSKPEHANLVVKNEEIKVSKKKKRKESEKTSEDNKSKALPEVSKETFYEVKQDLKESLQGNQSFSLLNMFGRNKESVIEEQVHPKEGKTNEVIENNIVPKGVNPFRYDSSDDEAHTERSKEAEAAEENTIENASLPQRHINLGAQKLWTEPFFFQADDYRFQDGFDFVRRFDVEDTEFSTVRRNIKEIVKAKVKHNQRKNKPFKKKLGGRKKLIKIKKAMKR